LFAIYCDYLHIIAGTVILYWHSILSGHFVLSENVSFFEVFFYYLYLKKAKNIIAIIVVVIIALSQP